MAIKRDKIIANAEKLVAKGKIEAAIKEYERLLADSPGDVNTLNRVGDLWGGVLGGGIDMEACLAALQPLWVETMGEARG